MSAARFGGRRLDARPPWIVDYTARVSVLRGFRYWAARVLQSSVAEDASGREPPGPAGELALGDAVGEYLIVRKIGEGGFGTVYEAAHPVIGKRAAVKILHAQYSADEAITSRFVAEARAVNQIRDRNIIDIFSFGALPDGRHYYVMELLEGVPLDTYLERAGRVPVEEALPILHVVAHAISAAHAAGIAHRDLKPGNIFLELDDEGNVYPKILDFGMAKLLGSDALGVHRTRSGAPIGSPRYMSPEQCRGVKVDHRTDVYAFGCIAYRMLTGTTAFEADTALELMMAHVSAPAVPPSSRCPEIGTEFDAAILSMLEKDPDDRPQTMEACYEILAKGADHSSHLGRPSKIPVSPLLRDMVENSERTVPADVDLSKLKRTGRRRQRRPPDRRAWAIAAGLGFLLVLLVVGLRSRVPSQSSPPSRASVTDRAVLAHPSPLTSGSSLKRPEPGPPPLPSTVAVTVRSRPVPAEIHYQGRKLGMSPGPVTIPRSEQTQTLILKAPRHAPAQVAIQPTGDLVVDVTLTPGAPRSPAVGVPRDLENPY